jgi:GMP synthase (glutamine-hydrolysing)
VQFHPEVSHSEEGSKMLENFVFGICKAEKNWKLTNYIEKTVAEIREKVGKDNVILIRWCRFFGSSSSYS